MAEKLIQYYKLIEDKMGMEGKQRLAKLTLIPSIIAATEPDSDQNIERFREAIKQLTGDTPPRF